MSSVCGEVGGDLSQSPLTEEALKQPVRDAGHSQILRGHVRGTQPFEKGLAFSNKGAELGWDQERWSGQCGDVHDLSEERVREEQTDEHGYTVTKKPDVVVKKGSQTVKRASLRKVKQIGHPLPNHPSCDQGLRSGKWGGRENKKDGIKISQPRQQKQLPK
ncbi:hypothetical protein JZ751_012146 [Albula glossodonta]|uniref:Uncharacterized protein n=1 Tax=Albula glossodonta TaxID=121402 RepID=A0A8T2PRJ7_9TELE|nr:hypothetical protein JZ751_012146 [Albula glossodonta]